MRVRRGWALGLLVASAACGSFGSNDSPKPSLDASSSPELDGSSDAGSDSPTSADVSAPDVTVIDASLVRPCSSPHWLCDDFDSDAGMSAPWTVSLPPPTLIPTGFSPPNALATALDADAGAIQSQVVRDVSEDMTGLACSFNVRIAKSGAPALYFFDVNLSNGSDGYRVGLNTGTGASGAVTVAAPPLAVAGGGTFTVGPWTPVEIEIRPTTGYLRVVVGGSLVIDKAAGQLPPIAIVKRVTIAFGVARPGPLTAGWQVDFDDIVCDKL